MGFNGSVVSSNSVGTDANWRAVGLAVHNQLAAFGLVQTADTGQVNWGTDVRPAATADHGHYEIWQFADALNASAPVFLRLEYATPYAVNGNLGFFFQVGTGTDGAGNLTGRKSALLKAYGNGNVSIWMAGDTGSLAIMGYLAGNTGCFLLVVERTHNAAGGDTGDGVMIAAVYYTYTGLIWANFQDSQIVEFAGDQSGPSYSQQNANSYWTPGWVIDGLPNPASAATGAIGNNVHFWPIKARGLTSVSPFLRIAAFFTADIAAGTVLTATGWDGASNSWSALGMFGGDASRAVRGASAEAAYNPNLSFMFRRA